MTAYAELQVTTHFSFLRGASSCEELFTQAALFGLAALGITDRHSLAGIVRAHEAAKVTGVRAIAGCRLDLSDGAALLLYPTDRAAYGRLCRLLTLGKARAGKGECDLAWGDVVDYGEGLIAVLVPDRPDALCAARLCRLARDFAGRAYLALSLRRRPHDQLRIHELSNMAAAARVATVATGDVLFHSPERRILQDVVTCIREGCTIDEAGFRRERHADRHLKRPEEMARLFARWPEAVARSLEIAGRVRFSLAELAYQYPDEVGEPGVTAQETLAKLTWEGAARRYRDGIPDKVAASLRHELRLIEELGYAPYFLTVHAIVRFARSRGILCQGRGSAANSAVCFVLGITAIDPARNNLLFERFVSRERREPPDIDVDFEHERREEVIQWIYDTYGRERAALCATVIRYRARGAVREVGKALGLSEDVTKPLAAQVWARGDEPRHAAERDLSSPALISPRMPSPPLRAEREGTRRVSGGEGEVGVGKRSGIPHLTPTLSAPRGGEGVSGRSCRSVGQPMQACLDPGDRRLRLTLDLARQLIGTPRHLSQHPGGFVLTRDRLDELVPIEPAAMAGRAVIEWDKDDIDALGFMKVDVLGLGMLGCLRRAFDLLERHKGLRLDLATIPAEDPETYAMIRRADTVGVFQIESRAQMAMLPRLEPRTFYDLVIEVAIVRPGPIQGDMVHPYLRRREGREPVEYPTPELERVLGKTLGVPLFQEQAMRIAIECAGFTPGEADQLRRSMATFRHTGGVAQFRDRLIAGMVARGYARAFAETTFAQLEGFGSYGFPESHAASFALLAYASSWIKCRHPDAFLAALLNAQPMGFYAPAQLVRDARRHGVEVRPVDVNASRWDCTLEAIDGSGRHAVRLGLRLVRGLANRDGAALVTARADRPFRSIEDLRHRAAIPRAALERLAAADAFRPALGLARREALWAIRALRDRPLPLFAAASARAGEPVAEMSEPAVGLRPMTAGREVVEDYSALGLSLRPHPMAFLRRDLAARRIVPCAEAGRARDGRRLTTAGLVLVRQRPGSANGVLFMTIEDETGFANIVVWPDLFERQRPVILSAGMLAVTGRVQREGEVVHVIAHALTDLSELLRSLGDRTRYGDSRDPRETPARKSRDIPALDTQSAPGIRIPTRDFR